MRRVQLLVRRECALCDQLMLALVLMRDRLEFEIETLDVDSEVALAQEFGEHVPVLRVGSQLIHQALDRMAMLEAEIEHALETQVQG